MVARIEVLPELIPKAVEALFLEQLNCSYRPGGWTLRQVVHHIVDSHINGCIRFKLALTEECPAITPFDETLGRIGRRSEYAC